MQINQYKKALPFLMKAKVTCLVWGNHGIGKSSAPQQFCDENGYKLFNLRLGSLEVGDLLGLGDFKLDATGKKVATQFFMPDWLKDLFDFCEQNPDKQAIIHLDEINRARRDILAPVFQMVLDYRLHTYEFPKNVFVIASANPPTDDYNVLDMSDKAFLDRFLHIKLAPSRKEWIDYAENKVDSSIINFIKDNNKMLEMNLEDFSVNDFAQPSRRSWEKVSDLLKAGTPKELQQELISGKVGLVAAVAFEEFLNKAEKPLTAEEILNNYQEHIETIKKHSSKKTNRADLLKNTCTDLEKFFEKNEVLSEPQGENLVAFINTIPVDLSFTLLRTIYLKKCCRDLFEKDKQIIERIKTAKEAIKKADKPIETVKKAKKKA